MTRRFQFSLRALLVAVLVAAAFFGGMVIQRERDKLRMVKDRDKIGLGSIVDDHWTWTEWVILQDGTRFSREWNGPAD